MNKIFFSAVLAVMFLVIGCTNKTEVFEMTGNHNIDFLDGAKELTYTAEVDGGIKEMSYLLLVPDGYENMEPLPVVLFLHGTTETWVNGTSETAILQRLIDTNKFPCVILVPKCIPGGNWCDWQMATLALGIADEVKNVYNCDSDKFYIIGFEMGAYAVYDFIGHEADNNGIAAAVSVGGAYMYELIDNIKNVPLWIFYGDGDHSSEDSMRMADELKKAGGNKFKATDYSGADNVIEFICGETDLFDWLFAQRKGL